MNLKITLIPKEAKSFAPPSCRSFAWSHPSKTQGHKCQPSDTPEAHHSKCDQHLSKHVGKSLRTFHHAQQAMGTKPFCHHQPGCGVGHRFSQAIGPRRVAGTSSTVRAVVFCFFLGGMAELRIEIYLNLRTCVVREIHHTIKQHFNLVHWLRCYILLRISLSNLDYSENWGGFKHWRHAFCLALGQALHSNQIKEELKI